MIATLIATGAIPLAAVAPPGAAVGPFDLPTERIAIAARIQAATSAASAGIPLGAAEWSQPFDPGDRRPFGFSFDQVLDEGDTIEAIERIAVSPVAAALGLTISEASGYGPTLDEDTLRRVKLWFAISDGQQGSPGFDASGARVGVTFRVRTLKQHVVERSGVLSLRNC